MKRNRRYRLYPKNIHNEHEVGNMFGRFEKCREAPEMITAAASFLPSYRGCKYLFHLKV